MPPIYQTSTYTQEAPAKHKGYEYTRTHNPTRTRLEECLASLEKARYSLVTSSGMSAASLMLHAIPHGSTIICGDDVYGGTYRLLTTVFNKNFTVQFVDTTDIKLLEKKIEELKPKLLWIESPTNPLLKITDIARAATVASEHECLSLVDNTFMSPYFQNPLELGADIVLHSMTKFINGHSDVVGGALLSNDKSLYDKLWELQNSTGPSMSPFDSWLVLRGIKTLAVRMEQHQKNALALAEWLEKHPQVGPVIYPGLPSHPQHQLAKKQMRGFGGMIAFYLKEGLEKSKKFLTEVKVFSLAESLGGVESLIEHPALMTHAALPPSVRQSLGIDYDKKTLDKSEVEKLEKYRLMIDDNLIRLSVGIEDIEDLQADLKRAFIAIKNSR